MRRVSLLIPLAILCGFDTSSRWRDRPEPLVIPTNAEWLGKATGDGKWKAADVIDGPERSGTHYTRANQFTYPGPAEWIWVAAVPACDLRRTFELRRGFRRAEMVFIADDVAAIRINGQDVAEYRTQWGGWGHKGGAALVDLTPWLVPGKNVVEARVRDTGGARGFAAEIRIDGHAVVPSLARLGRRLPAGVKTVLERLSQSLGSESPALRTRAERDLMELVERHGCAMQSALERLKEGASGHGKERLGAALDRIAPSLRPTVGNDGRFGYARIPAEKLRNYLAGDRNANVLVRRLISYRAFATASPGFFVRTATAALKGGDPADRLRIVQTLALLEIPASAGTLAGVVREEMRSPAAAYAAAALGRMGAHEHRDVLEEAARCGFAPTERAARVALSLSR